MKSPIAILAVTAALASPALAQPEAPEQIITAFQAAPGHQVALLEWLARNDAADRAAGVPPCQLFVHLEGAKWDVIQICPMRTREQDQAVDAELAKLGGPSGWQAGIEMRKHIADHSDTLVLGPTTAAEHLARIGASGR